MITRDNLKDLLKTLKKEEVIEILNSNNEYIELEALFFNDGVRLDYTLTDSLDNLEELASNGNCILEVEEIKDILLKINN